MGSVPVFQDPYGENGKSPTQIDRLIGTAYDVVRDVAENLEYVKHVSAHLVQIYRVYQSVDGIDVLHENIEGLEELLAHLDEIILVATNMEDLILVAQNMNLIDELSQNMVQLLAIHENLDAILDAGGTVIVSDTPPSSIIQGKLWWDSDSGDLFAYYDDGSSGQWIQVNIANPVYNWTEITGKPTTFPPSGHIHSEYVKDTGDTMTGNLTIAPPATLHATLFLKSLGVTANAVVGQTVNPNTGAGSDRWAMFLGDTRAESGTAIGSDFQLRRYNNVGAVIDSPIIIARDTGIPYFKNGLQTPLPHESDHEGTVATIGYVEQAVSGIDEILGSTFKVYGKDVIHVPPDGDIGKTSLAYGDGLKKSVSSISPEGMFNVAVGFRSLLEMTTGSYNTLTGYQSGSLITTGRYNTGAGVNALCNLTTGSGNTAFGMGAIFGDPPTPDDPSTVGDWSFNTAVGFQSMYEIASGASYNIGIGVSALANPGVSKGLSGDYNNGVGGAVMHNLENGNYNQAFGYAALADLVAGNNNIAIGHNTGRGLTIGSGNVIIGHGIVGLTAGLTNTLILATGDGTRAVVGSPAGVAVLGTNTNDVGLAGYSGEYRETNTAATAAVVLTSNIPKTVAQLTLTAGDWDVFGWVAFTTVATTSVTRLWGSVSMAANAIDQVTPGASCMETFPATVPGAATAFRYPVGHRRVSIAASSLVYLTALGTFTLGSLSAWGKIWARRAR